MGSELDGRGQDVAADAQGAGGAAGADPGKRSRTARLGGGTTRVSGPASEGQGDGFADHASEGLDDPFAIHLEGAAPAASEVAKGGAGEKKAVAEAAGDGAPATDVEARPGAAAAAGSGAGAPAAAAGAAAAPPAAEAKQERVAATAELAGTGVESGGTSRHAVASDVEAKAQAVAATGAPTFNAAAGSNDCTPGAVSGASIGWTVVDSPATWGVSVTSFTTTGVINVAPWPSKPTDMTTPNTANPVDGGNITDASGNNNWKFAVKEMEEYHQAGGGRSSYWHSYEASKAHEWAHWNTDWMVTCIGALWPTANTDLDAITIPKASAADATIARPLLQAKIDQRMKTLQTALVAKWNPIPDSPGAAGSTGYDAGQAVLNGLITKVKAYAATKKWV